VGVAPFPAAVADVASTEAAWPVANSDGARDATALFDAMAFTREQSDAYGPLD
jgi:hypothetical protein